MLTPHSTPQPPTLGPSIYQSTFWPDEFDYSRFLICMLHAKPLQSCPTLCDPVDCSPPGSWVHGILQASMLEWVTISFSKWSPMGGIKGILWHVLLSRLSKLPSCHKLSWMKMAVWFPALSFSIMTEVRVVSFSSHTSWKLLSVDFQRSTPTTRFRSHIIRSASHRTRPQDRAPLSLWGSVRLLSGLPASGPWGCGRIPGTTEWFLHRGGPQQVSANLI